MERQEMVEKMSSKSNEKEQHRQFESSGDQNQVLQYSPWLYVVPRDLWKQIVREGLTLFDINALLRTSKWFAWIGTFADVWKQHLQLLFPSSPELSSASVTPFGSYCRVLKIAIEKKKKFKKGAMVVWIALRENDFRLVEEFWNKAISDEEYPIFANEIFRFAMKKGCVTVLDWLYGKVPDKEWKEMFRENSDLIFWAAGNRGYKEMLEWVWGKASEEQWRKMIQKDGYEIFFTVADNGYGEILDWLWEKTPDEDKKKIIKHDRYLDLFYGAFKHNHTVGLDWLWAGKIPLGQEQEVLQRYGYSIWVREAQSDRSTQRDNTIVLDWLWGKTPLAQKSAMLQQFGFTICRVAAGRGWINVLNWVWAKAYEVRQGQEMLEAVGLQAFSLAIGNSDIKVSNWFWEKASLFPELKIQESMMRYKNFEAFYHGAIEGNNQDMAVWLWKRMTPVIKEECKTALRNKLSSDEQKEIFQKLRQWEIIENIADNRMLSLQTPASSL